MSSRLVSHLPSGGAILPSVAIPGPFAKIWSLVGSILSPLGVWGLSKRPGHNEAAHLANLADSDMAEKFAKELLWITQKLLSCGGIEEAVQQWSSASPLAELSLCASPKVQKSLVRLSGKLSSPCPNLPCRKSGLDRMFNFISSSGYGRLIYLIRHELLWWY